MAVHAALLITRQSTTTPRPETAALVVQDRAATVPGTCQPTRHSTFHIRNSSQCEAALYEISNVFRRIGSPDGAAGAAARPEPAECSADALRKHGQHRGGDHNQVQSIERSDDSLMWQASAAVVWITVQLMPGFAVRFWELGPARPNFGYRLIFNFGFWKFRLLACVHLLNLCLQGASWRSREAERGPGKTKRSVPYAIAIDPTRSIRRGTRVWQQ